MVSPGSNQILNTYLLAYLLAYSLASYITSFLTYLLAYSLASYITDFRTYLLAYSQAHGIHTKEARMYFTELCANFAGNAWSAWHFLPIKMATVATQGYFSKENGQQQTEPKTQKEQEEIPSAQVVSSSSSDED